MTFNIILPIICFINGVVIGLFTVYLYQNSSDYKKFNVDLEDLSKQILNMNNKNKNILDNINHDLKQMKEKIQWINNNL